MTYASIAEAWGGVSGSNQLSTPLEKRLHPLHEQQIDRRKSQKQQQQQQQPTQEEMVQYQQQQQQQQQGGPRVYQCKYGSHDCDQIQRQNTQFNNKQKRVAEGLQDPEEEVEEAPPACCPMCDEYIEEHHVSECRRN